jgi:hypothetical protein
MRQRLRQLRGRPMARPLGERGRINLSPRARLIGGWLAALLLVLGIAAAVRIFGGNADGDAVLPSASTGEDAGPLPITFGTALDEARLVPDAARTTRFAAGDTFAYAVHDAPPASTVYVSVERTADGTLEVVQPPDDAQTIPGAPANIGFTVPADALFEAWGPGTYLMRVYLEAGGEPLAEGSFTLIDPAAPLPTPSEEPD